MTHKETIKGSVALVPAAGSGERLGLGPKAFLKLEGQSLMERVVRNLQGCVERVVVGVPSDLLQIAQSTLGKKAEVFSGGATRQETIYLLMKKTNEPLILIHDATRPFASQRLFREVIQVAQDDRAATAFASTHIPAAIHKDGFITSTIPRSDFIQPQTPNAFQRKVLEEVYQRALEDGVELQSTVELVVRMGLPVRVIPDEEHNIKITVPFDWDIARKVIAPSLQSDKDKGM